MQRKLFYLLYIATFLSFSLSSNAQDSLYNGIYEDKLFFKQCNIGKNDAFRAFELISSRNLDYNEISKIDHDGLRRALYLLSLSVNGSTEKQKDLIFSVLGKHYLLKIPQIRKQVIQHLAKNINTLIDAINVVGYGELSYNDKITLLYAFKNNNREKDPISEHFVQKIIQDLMTNYQIEDNDLYKILTEWKIEDSFLLAQIRQTLYTGNIDSAKNICNLVESEEIKKNALNIIKFEEAKSLNLNNSSNNTGRKYIKEIKNNKKISTKYDLFYKDNQKNNNKKFQKFLDYAAEMIGKDEYIDLFLINHYKDDVLKKYKVLQARTEINLKPEIWLKHQIGLAKEIIRSNINNKNEIAYAIMTERNHNVSKRINYAEQQWLSGYIAFLSKDYIKASYHFNEYASNSIYVTNIAKGYYWLGLSLRKQGQTQEAKIAFKKASLYPFSFYGQNAAEEISIDPKELIKSRLLKLEEMSSVKDENICKEATFIASYLAYHLGTMQYGYIKTFFDNETDDLTMVQGLKILEKDTKPNFYREIAKHASNYNITLKETTFPALEQIKKPLIKAIVKQESAFQKNAVSHKGAHGLMQLVPDTAKEIAAQLGVKYDTYRLLTDEAYNLVFGQHYINKLLTRYNNHKVLVLAAYNAGPSRVNKWLEKNGDIRNKTDNESVVLWTEAIPIAETKDYVIKILGSELVYEAID
jgi:soluble lytic murein transglycosylase-like protein